MHLGGGVVTGTGAERRSGVGESVPALERHAVATHPARRARAFIVCRGTVERERETEAEAEAEAESAADKSAITE